MRPVETARFPSLLTPSRALSQALRVLATWEKRRRTRKNLNALSAHMLADIGLDPIRAELEASKPFWRA